MLYDAERDIDMGALESTPNSHTMRFCFPHYALFA